ncbi:MAG TPA: NifB/NifX family molybdenum-iron cluster-binding protein [Propionibacteriaceae bacterium]|nr:NifB/NifX family molybdenum-iron cluster-binding protein [Propionibacteriaceae bacterium]
MYVATPVDAHGQSAHAWGRAHWIAVADVSDVGIASWEVHEVGWDELHDSSTHGSHHARVVSFLKDQHVQAIVVDHVGEGMQRMLTTMGIPMLPASPGDAKASVLTAVRGAQGLHDETTPAN